LLKPRRADEVGARADRVDGSGLRYDVLRASYLIGNSIAQVAGSGIISYPHRNGAALTAPGASFRMEVAVRRGNLDLATDVMLKQLMRIVETAGLTAVRCSTEN